MTQPPIPPTPISWAASAQVAANGTPGRKSYGGLPLVPVSEMRSGVRIGIYGPGGIGKTTLAATVVDTDLGSPALYINARGNPEVARSRGDKITVVTPTKFSEVEGIRQSLVADKDMPFKSVIMDSLTEVHALDLRDRYGTQAEIGWTMHSATTSDLLQLARNWSDLAITHNLNIIFVAWDTPETRKIRGEEVQRSEMAFNKALQSQLPGIISWLGRLYIVDDRPPYTRLLDFRPIEKMHQAKFQIDPDDVRTKDIPMEQYNPSLASIIDTVVGGKPWPKEKHAQPKANIRA